MKPLVWRLCCLFPLSLPSWFLLNFPKIGLDCKEQSTGRSIEKIRRTGILSLQPFASGVPLSQRSTTWSKVDIPAFDSLTIELSSGPKISKLTGSLKKRKKMVCREEIFGSHRKRGRSARSSPSPHHTLAQKLPVSPPGLFPPWL